LSGRKTLNIRLELEIEVSAVSLLSVIPPSKFEGEHIQKFVQRMTKKRGPFKKKPLEDIIHQGMVWMPYYRIQYTYGQSGEDSRRYNIAGRSETALNAMLCGSAKSEKEIVSLFRPNYLKHKTIRHFPQSEEIVGPTADLDFDEFLNGLLKHLNRVEDELYELRSVLSKKRVRLRRYSMIVPLLRHLKKNEEKLSEKVAGLMAIKSILRMCLNVNDDLDSIKVTSYNVFYFPTLLIKLVHKEDRTERYLIINLVKSGLISRHLSCDKGLTELCNKNSMCKEIIARLLNPTSKTQLP